MQQCKYSVHLFIIFTLSACSTLPRNPVPLNKLLQAELTGIDGARAWAGEYSAYFEEDLLSSIKQEQVHNNVSKSSELIAANVLSISGGGGHGAFGAGVLNGWSESGNRPEFKLVTGISTGALIAPFAFLGAAYDEQLKQAFTTIGEDDIYKTRWLSFLWSDAFTDTSPLAKLINKYITADLLNEVAKAHRQGRRLYIGTTNLDADRLVVWNMGVIANSRSESALTLFRQIILASSSVPGVFPPVMIKVNLEGKDYDEMHVDGGIKTQFFLLATTLDIEGFRIKLYKREKSIVKSKIFVIRNAKFDPEPEHVSRNLASISKRSIESLIKAQALDDLERLYLLANKHKFDFNWLALPSDYHESDKGEFNTEKMNRLFNTGYKLGLKKNKWNQNLPVKINQR